jgi:hypothetical protein
VRIPASLLAVVWLPASFATQAELRGVFTAGVSLARFDGGDDDITPTNVSIRLGAAVNRFVEVGAEAGLTLLADDVNAAAINIGVGGLF